MNCRISIKVHPMGVGTQAVVTRHSWLRRLFRMPARVDAFTVSHIGMLGSIITHTEWFNERTGKFLEMSSPLYGLLCDRATHEYRMSRMPACLHA